MILDEPRTDDIAVERRPHCHVCGAEGRQMDYQLRDRLHSVPGDWRLRMCPAPDCGLVWLDPMPSPSEIRHLYPHGYFTHAPQRHGIQRTDAGAGDSSITWQEQFRHGWRNGLARVDRSAPARHPGLWERIGNRAAILCRIVPGIGPQWRHPELWMPRPFPSAKLLDVGCGSGQFLARMHGLGWEVVGVEPDPAAVRAARATYGLHVVQGTLESLQNGVGEFDALTLLHVIEHVPDPRETLHAAWRVLRPGGRLLIVTPNGRGLGSRVFGSAWINWDPPRHLHVFTVAALHRLLVETGFAPERTCTTGRNARWTWEASAEVRNTGRCRCVDQPRSTAASRWGGRLARLAENVLPGRNELGEELVAIGVKPPGDMLRASPAHSVAR